MRASCTINLQRLYLRAKRLTDGESIRAFNREWGWNCRRAFKQATEWHTYGATEVRVINLWILQKFLLHFEKGNVQYDGKRMKRCEFAADKFDPEVFASILRPGIKTIFERRKIVLDNSVPQNEWESR